MQYKPHDYQQYAINYCELFNKVTSELPEKLTLVR